MADEKRDVTALKHRYSPTVRQSVAAKLASAKNLAGDNAVVAAREGKYDERDEWVALANEIQTLIAQAVSTLARSISG